jgi:hypothetical protein
MVEDSFVFNYTVERMLRAYRQAEEYSKRLGSSEEMEIGNNYNDTIKYEEMLSSASYAALVFSNPQRRKGIFKQMGGASPFEWNILDGTSSKEVRKLCEDYSLGNRKITEDQLKHIKEVCLALEEYIIFIRALKEEAVKEVKS